MAQRKGGLGKGFSDLFLDNSADALSDSGAVTLPIGEIEPDRSQPRQFFDDEALSELTDSIREHGVLQPLLVRPTSDGSYRIVAGERRWRAARQAGLTQVPVIVRALTDSEAAVIALIENLQREDLNAVEQAQGIRRLMETYGLTQDQVADKLSKSRPAVANTLRLLALPEDVQALVSDGALSAGHARALLGLKDETQVAPAAEKVIGEKLSVRQTEALVKAMNRPPRAPQQRRLGNKDYEETALALSEALGRRVKVVAGEKGGRLEIELFDAEDLKKLVSAFNEDQ